MNNPWGKVASLTLVLALLIGGLLPAAGVRAAGTVSLTALNSTYTENFDTLASSGTANTVVPNGWEFAETGTNANTTYRAGTGSDNTGDTYSFGASGNSERAFGGLRSGSLVPMIGAQFANNTGFTITSLAISYTGEQWRLGQNTTGRSADRLDFQVSTDAAGLTSGTWINVDDLDFYSPAVAGTVGALNGNDAANRTTLSFTVTGLSIPNGATFWIRWADTDLTPGADDGLSVDDFSLSADGELVPEEAPTVTSTDPADGATEVAQNANLAITFSEPVNVSGEWFTLTCSVSGAVTATTSGGPTTFTLDPDVDLAAGETCTLTIIAANVSDQDNNDPPDNLTVDFSIGFQTFDACTQTITPIYTIQGSGPVAAITGPVTTRGVVTGDYEYNGISGDTLRGFYIQDAAGDSNAATSDAIFVFNGNNNNVALGDVVVVTGSASEFQDQTQISATSVLDCGDASLTPVDVTLPFPSPTYLEQFEGMLVRLPQTLYVTEHFQLGRFGQVVMSSGDRLQQPTNVVEPGAPAQALQAANNLNRIIIDDASQLQNPDPILFGRGGQPLSASNTLRGGDTATNIVGIMTYTWAGNAASGNAYRVRPINALSGGVPDFQPANPRPAAPPNVGGSLRVSAMNLLNFFNTFDGLPDNVNNCTNGVGGAATDCRGADTQAEFDRQWPKTVAAIVGAGADVIGVNEIENDGYGPSSALQFLVDQLNAATAPGTYAFIDVDAATGQINALGTDAIKVGMLYKPGKVTPVGQTAVLNSVAFVNGGDGSARSRPSLAQAFQENASGARFVVDVNHLKSKSSPCDAPDAGDGQGNCNTVRVNAATELVSWLASDPTGTGETDVLIMGDLNSYAKEDPVDVILSAGYTNLIEAYLGPDAYSYVFDGQWGYLDHALGSGSILSQITGVGDWHINADEPSVLDYNTDFKTPNLQAMLYAPDQYRVSDHDVVIVGLELDNLPPTIESITAPVAPVPLGSPVAITATFTDPGVADTHTATIDWGDGNVTSGTVAEANGSGTITGSHVYAAPGVYDITVTVTDNHGGSDTEVYSFVVVFNPTGGFVTGGGWLDSQPGYYFPDPTASGMANFGLVARYKSGSQIPEGKFQLKLEEADFEFLSTNYNWLVINGSKAQLRGSGTINGQGNYQFQLWATHGNPGSLRVRIWYQDASGVHVVYDNGVEQALGGGKITVHK